MQVGRVRKRISSSERILVARIGALGDTLMATPVLSALRKWYPGFAIDVLASAGAAPLLRGHPAVEHVFGLRGRNWPLLLSPEKLALSLRLRRRRYRLGVLLESAPRYRRLLESAGVRELRGFRETPFRAERHAIVNNLAAALGRWDEEPPDMELPIDARHAAAAERLLEGLGPDVAGLHVGYGPGQRKQGQTDRLKGWSLANFARLASLLLSEGTDLVLTGSPGDIEAVARVERAVAGPPQRVRNLAGRTGVLELAALIERLRVFVSVDSGPAHMAAAVGTPLVVLWGPAKLQQVRPVSSRSPVVVVREPVPCAPCYDTPAMKSCRLNVCMQRITPERVAAVTLELLRG